MKNRFLRYTALKPMEIPLHILNDAWVVNLTKNHNKGRIRNMFRDLFNRKKIKKLEYRIENLNDQVRVLTQHVTLLNATVIQKEYILGKASEDQLKEFEEIGYIDGQNLLYLKKDKASIPNSKEACSKKKPKRRKKKR